MRTRSPIPTSAVQAKPVATTHRRRALTPHHYRHRLGTARLTSANRRRKPPASLFAVVSLLEACDAIDLALPRDQRRVDKRPARDCWVRVENKPQAAQLRRGLNQNNGTPQRDCFILRRDGTIEGDIDWDYDQITRVEARPMDERPLILKGGVFTTTANRMKQAKGYNYWARNISIRRSNTTVVGLTHHIVGETDTGHPYGGFLSVSSCANVTLRDCFVTGHKTYTTIGAAGKPVSMGTYDLSANEVVNFTMIGCRMENICDSTRGLHWGNLAEYPLENCTLSRMETHHGVSGTYRSADARGHAGLNAIAGQVEVENST